MAKTRSLCCRCHKNQSTEKLQHCQKSKPKRNFISTNLRAQNSPEEDFPLRMSSSLLMRLINEHDDDDDDVIAVPVPFPPLPSRDNAEDVGQRTYKQTQTKFRAFWLKFDRFWEFWNHFFCGRIRMKYRIKTIIVTRKISFILYDFIGFRS